MRSSDCSPPIAPITEPAPMNSSALKNACVIRWNSPAAYANDRDAHDHVADLRHRRVGDHAFEVGDHERDRGGDHQRGRAADRRHVGRRRRLLEQRVHARDQVHARGDHRGGVDQRGDGRGALHRVRQPGVQRQLRGLGERADQEQDARRHQRPLVDRERVVRAREHRAVVQGVHAAEQQERAHDHADVADHVDHERLHAGGGGRAPPVPERDQQVRRRAHERPAHDQQHEVAGQDQQQHREDEEVEVGEVARVARGRTPCRRPSRRGSGTTRR